MTHPTTETVPRWTDRSDREWPIEVVPAWAYDKLREELRQMTERKDAVNETLAQVVGERNQLRSQMERATGLLRNCSGKIYHPRMPNLVAALEKEITELTNG